MSLIKTSNLCKEFRTDSIVTKVLFDINLEIKQGEFVAIMGPSGSGKSTLMHIISFLSRPTSGKLFFKDKDATTFSDEDLAHLRNNEIGFVFQQFYLLPRTSVLDNVKLPLTYSKKIKKDKFTFEAVKAVDLEHRKNNLSNQLSGGEKQRVAIARALVTQPQIIFADEPTGNLDSKSGAQVMNILDSLNKQGKTIILVTHEKYTAEYAERILEIHDGRITSDRKVQNRKHNGLLK